MGWGKGLNLHPTAAPAVPDPSWGPALCQCPCPCSRLRLSLPQLQSQRQEPLVETSSGCPRNEPGSGRKSGTKRSFWGCWVLDLTNIWVFVHLSLFPRRKQVFAWSLGWRAQLTLPVPAQGGPSVLELGHCFPHWLCSHSHGLPSPTAELGRWDSPGQRSSEHSLVGSWGTISPRLADPAFTMAHVHNLSSLQQRLVKAGACSPLPVPFVGVIYCSSVPLCPPKFITALTQQSRARNYSCVCECHWS